MQTSKFLKNSSRRKSAIYTPPFNINNLELYPRMRRTEFYHEASIPEEYQSRDYEHPQNLDRFDPMSMDDHRKLKIIPPKNSEMRVIRDSYFS